MHSSGGGHWLASEEAKIAFLFCEGWFGPEQIWVPRIYCRVSWDWPEATEMFLHG